MIKVIEIILSVLMIYGLIQGLREIMPRVDFDFNFIGFMFCFVMMIILYCLYS